ncbi:MAG: hypothetical protein QXN26_01465 [Thermoplasmataceae archaeon]
MSGIQVLGFRMSKLGNRPKDCEDFYSWDLARMKFAIADGASSSIFSDIWAQSLTQAAMDENLSLDGSPESLLSIIMKVARKNWYGGIQWTGLPWFLRNKSVSGSHSTLLLMQTWPLASSYRYSAVAVGDTCMFVLKDHRVEDSFPLKSYTDFGSTPSLVWSGKGSPIPANVRMTLPKYSTMSGTIDRGSTVVLATDAVSKWILEHGEPQELLEAMGNDHAMKALISREINARRMRNDDTAIIVIRFI